MTDQDQGEQMRVFVLRRIGDYDGGWTGHEYIDALVVRAENPSEARRTAAKGMHLSGKARAKEHGRQDLDPTVQSPWRNPDKTTCEDILQAGHEAEVIAIQKP